MKIKKFITLMLVAVILITAVPLSVTAKKTEIAELFKFGIGPETDGYSIDYRYFSPVKENDTIKYPLVIWLHGMGDGAKEGRQIEKNDIVKWTSDDFQSRFKDSAGAFIFAPRSLEEKGLYWDDELVYPLRATIDDFIEQHKDNIDVKRIYVGGYSMGGKMTLKMAVAYPDMFAAIYPICPAWIPGDEAVEYLKDTPIWMVSGASDSLVKYYTYVMPTWDRICQYSNNPENCRLSTLMLTLYPNGIICGSSHWSWFSVNNDMFSSKNGDYPLMKTQNGCGKTIKLMYPDGMISWLSGFSSDFDGSKATDSGNYYVLSTDGRPKGLNNIWVGLKNRIIYLKYIFDIK